LVSSGQGRIRQPCVQSSYWDQTRANIFLMSTILRGKLVPRQSFPETWQPAIGAPVTVYTGGDAQKWRINHIRQGIGTSITIKHENSEMIVDKSWFIFDINMGSLDDV